MKKKPDIIVTIMAVFFVGALITGVSSVFNTADAGESEVVSGLQLGVVTNR